MSSRPRALIVDRLALEGEGGVARDDEGASNPGKIGRQAIGYAVDEELQLGIAAEIGERAGQRSRAVAPLVRVARPYIRGLPVICHYGWRDLAQSVEPISLSGHRHDQPRLLLIRLDLAPEPADQHIDATVEQLKATTGDGIEKRSAAQHPTRPRDEGAKKRELAAGQGNRLAQFAGKHAGADVENETREAHERRRFCGRFRAARFRNVAHRRPSRSRTSSFLRSCHAVYNAFTAAPSAVYGGSPDFDLSLLLNDCKPRVVSHVILRGDRPDTGAQRR